MDHQNFACPHKREAVAPSTAAMKVTPQLLLSVCRQKPRTNEPEVKFLARQTHMHLNNKRLVSSKLPKDGSCVGLRCLYLFENEIEVLEGLGSLPVLTHLYVQDNLIHTIHPDVGSLSRLQKVRATSIAAPSAAALNSRAAIELVRISAVPERQLPALARTTRASCLPRGAARLLTKA
jgi:Leucine-rich repeat (LRR) protein